MPDKDEIARVIAEAHRRVEPAINRIVRVVADENSEADSSEPIKLLEVNPDTSASGILPIGFGADPPNVPFRSVVVEVTHVEFDDIEGGRLVLRDCSHLGHTPYPTTA